MELLTTIYGEVLTEQLEKRKACESGQYLMTAVTNGINPIAPHQLP